MPESESNNTAHSENPSQQEAHLLTPELLEDEAIRADFMLRWAVVLLAVLLACSAINTTRTLVHIKTGEYLAGHGMIPSGADPFSYTTENRSWVNLSWLFDTLAAGAYGLMGPSGLTLGKAAAIGLAFYLIVHISLPGVSSWWNSICAGIALVACFRQFTATTEIMTLLGIACLFWLLYRWKINGAYRYLWSVVGLLFLWGQLDNRMFIGLWILLLYGIGEYVGMLFERPGLETEAQRKTLWQVIGCSLVVVLIHPFGWQTLLAPWKLFVWEYPALRARFPNPTTWQTLQYHPLLSSAFWQRMGRQKLLGC